VRTFLETELRLIELRKSGDTMTTRVRAKELAREVKEKALKSGASLVGIVSSRSADNLPSIWVGWEIRENTKKASELMPDAASVVVVGYHVWDDMLELAIRKGEKWVYPSYFPLKILTLELISFLETKGYRATLPHSLSYKRLAQLAGFGNYGKNALIINPEFGPWIRLSAILTNAEMTPDRPFEENICGDCEECVKACPVGALAPYKVDDAKCLVGVHLSRNKGSKNGKNLSKYEPSLTRNSHLMCMECQKACPHGREKRGSSDD
jgi:epoxyqueuosine reductase